MSSSDEYSPLADADADDGPTAATAATGKRKMAPPERGSSEAAGSNSTGKQKTKKSKIGVIESDDDDDDDVMAGGGVAASSGTPEEEVGNHRKKLKRDKQGRLLLNVGFTGARAGDVLEGSQDDTQGVVMKVASGVVYAPLKVRRLVDGASDLRDEFVLAVMRQHGVSRAVAELRIADFPVSDATASGNSRPNHQPLGSGCHSGVRDLGCTSAVGEVGACAPEATFTLLQPGKFQQFADEAGHGAELMKMVTSMREICWRDLLMLVGKKTLILRPKLFVVAAGPQRLSDAEAVALGAGFVDATVLDSAGVASLLRFEHSNGETDVIKLPPSGECTLPTDRVLAIVLAAVPTAVQADVHASIAMLSRLTLGGLKSALQKAIRFGAMETSILPLKHGDKKVKVDTGVYAATCAALMVANRGTFLPELQLFTRGCA